MLSLRDVLLGHGIVPVARLTSKLRIVRPFEPLITFAVAAFWLAVGSWMNDLNFVQTAVSLTACVGAVVVVWLVVVFELLGELLHPAPSRATTATPLIQR